MSISSVPLLDINRANRAIRDELLAAIAEVVDSGRFLYGPAIAALESEFAAICEVDHGVGCASGSDALLLSLMLEEVGPGDEVILPSFTFFATGSAVWRLGATPVFVDICPDTFNVDPAALDSLITPRTKAILPVHLFGQAADMDQINAIADKHNIAVIEDAAQAVGAKWRDRAVGGIGKVGCFSFYPTKNLGGVGDGGMLTTNDDDVADRLRLLSSHGMRPRYYHHIVGINSRLDTIQAAALRVKLRHLEQAAQQRRRNAARYAELFEQEQISGELELPATRDNVEHVWNQFTVRIKHGRRDEVREQLAARNIGSEIYYPVPLHKQACFASLEVPAGSLPESERAASEVLSLPIFPELTPDEQQHVVTALGEILRSKRAAA
ncbi:MAG: DegT/DnrJ/EryC1/StrS family aminotransferase [Pirellulaceae bacterium]|jgi:dTDP-4-amino-4,6-dideoxygalactose transaminase|nr:DegT/DnrJ/EryC1/StrS family aminotransferase [Pirellulaceae bacterium]MDP7014734.1 DegT/DnrJ/EryC1/StrS family aminotransferase [Pirellulaceae bacterium]